MRALSIYACLALASTAQAQFSVTTTSGSPIPASGTGSINGWDPSNIDHDITQTSPPATASVTVPVTVTSIDSVTIGTLSHTWMGDLQVVLRDPDGVAHLIFLRPEIEIGETCCGNAGNFTGGNYTFVEAGTDPASNGPLPQTGDAAPGVWDQTFSSNDAILPVMWPDGEEGIFNTPMTQITGPSGDWTLEIYDWAANDTGSFFSFTLDGNGGGNSIGTPYCAANANSTGSAGSFSAQGSASVMDAALTITGSDLPAVVNGIGVYGPNQTTTPFLNGFRCVALPFQRSVFLTADGSGVMSYDTFDPLQNSQAVVPLVAGTLNFQIWYRDSMGGGAGANTTNGLEITLVP